MSEDFCHHSMTKPDCLPCHKGVIERQDAHIERLREMLVAAGAGDALAEHDAHWFGGNARPLPVDSHRAEILARSPSPKRYDPPITVAEPIYNDQGFSAGFRIIHPPGVECSFPPDTGHCTCGKSQTEDV